jgi:hypothetical protein
MYYLGVYIMQQLRKITINVEIFRIRNKPRKPAKTEYYLLRRFVWCGELL